MLMREFESGRLKPVIAQTFPLEKVADAHAYLQSRANVGKVVLTTYTSP
jgi:NADPH2:quinone reductase